MSKPRYVDRDDEIVYRPPYLQKDSFLSSFLIRSSVDAQQQILDEQLNNLSGGKPYRYKALLGHVALVLANIGQVRSTDPRDSERGWVSEVDVCWWVLTAAMDGDRIDHLAWYIPYIWVNNPYTMVNGRETFGFPKSFATSRIPTSPQDIDGEFYADAFVLPTYTPQTEVQQLRILTLQRGPTNIPVEVVEGIEALERVVKQVVGHTIQDLELAAQIVREVLSAKMPVVYLKQFRDIVDPTAACYQAIIESNTTIHAFNGAGLLPFGFTVSTVPMASVDVAKHFGFDVSTGVDIAMWAKLDFSVDLGKEVWRAPT
jgi:hypothetical protein